MSQSVRFLQTRPRVAGLVMVVAALLLLSLFLFGQGSSYGIVKFQIPHVIGMTSSSSSDANGAHGQQTGRTSEIMERFQRRQQHLQRVCSQPEYQRPDTGVHFTKYRYQAVGFGRLRWCRIAKVGTTFMKGKFATDIRLQNPHMDKDSQTSLLKHPKTYYFVREPYSRVLSGFLDKVMVSPDRWADIGRIVIESQRKSATRKEIECGSDASFLEFFKYVIWAETKNKTRNIHFMPMHDLCDVCNRHYDYIGRLETISEDLPFILNSVGVDIDIAENTTSDIAGKIEKTFGENREMVERCVGIYPMMKRLWWTFQARGVIADTMPLPASQQEVETASAQQLASWAAQAHHDTLRLGSRSEQKRAFRITLLRSIPFRYRLRFVELYKKDFQLYEYDPLPSDYFPELSGVKNDYEVS